MPSTTKKATSLSPRNVKVDSPKQGAAGAAGGGAVGGGGEPVRAFRRKRRAWLFRVEGATNHGEREEETKEGCTRLLPSIF